MKLIEAENLTKELLVKFELKGWKFAWLKRMNKFSTAGQCRYKSKTIFLQPTYVELNTDSEIRNTILHEIAHALMPKHGHNKFWKRKAIEIGCTGERHYPKTVIRKRLIFKIIK